MDRTQLVGDKPPVSKAILVTLIALISSNAGFAVGIFARTVGQLTAYEASGAGAGAAVTAFGISMGVAMFVRSTSHQ